MSFNTVPSLLPSPQLFPQILMVENFTVQLPEDDGNVAVSKRPPPEFTVQIRKSGQLMTIPVFVSAGFASVAVVATGSISLTPKGVLSAGSSRRILDADYCS